MNRRLYVLVLALLLVSLPVWGYTVVLKDGTQIETREEYRRDAGRVYLVLPNGTETFIDEAEVDFGKTEKFNEDGAGQARVLNRGTVIEEESEQKVYEPETLRQLAGRRSLALPEAESDRVEDEAPRTSAGFVDLWHLERLPYGDSEVVEELRRCLGGLGVEDYDIFQGSSEDRVLIEMVTKSEAAIFESLKAAASALVQVQTRFPDKLGELELVLSTAVASTGQRAGQFVLTRELADDLLSAAIEPSMFFYRHVQF